MKRTLLLLLTPLLLHGCFASKSFVSFEILEPAPVSYPVDVAVLGFVNRSPLGAYSMEPDDSLRMRRETRQIIDTIVSRNLEKGFIEGIGQSGVEPVSDIRIIHLRRMDTIGQNEPMEPGRLKKVFDLNGLDALVSLENYGFSLYRSYSYYSFETLDHTQEFMLELKLLWRVYVRGNSDPLEEYIFHDTLYYYNYSEMDPGDYWDGAAVIRDGARDAGFRYGLRLVPVWVGVSRVLFRGGEKELVEAARFADQGRWEEAVALWSALTDHPSDRIAAKAHHNLAISLELDDRVEAALEQVRTAYILWENSYIEKYMDALDKRLTEREKLLRQIN